MEDKEKIDIEQTEEEIAEIEETIEEQIAEEVETELQDEMDKAEAEEITDRIGEVPEAVRTVLAEVNQEKEADDQEKNEKKEEFWDRAYVFVVGLLSGVLVVLLLIALLLMRYRAALEKRQLQNETEVADETELSLNMDELFQKVSTIEYCINNYSLYQTDREKVEENIFDGIMKSLNDPYSVYYTTKELEAEDESNIGEYTGIGATLYQDPETDGVFVSSCFIGSPAMEGGLLIGDQILKVNDLEVKGEDLSDIITYIKKGEDDTLNMKILRGGEELDIVIIRGVVEVPTVSGEFLEEGLGYIIISEFDVVTSTQFSDALEELQEQGLERLIIDVRDNPGGVLQTVVSVLDRILPEGLIVYIEDKYGERTEYTSDEENQLTIPIVVLINGNSASASEIFAGAIKDYGIGTLVGETTFGKGIVQNQFSFKDGTGIKLTVAKYYTPNGHDIHKVGIDPDVEIELDFGDATEYSHEVDNQLQKAIEVVNSL